jgi:Cd2+/Zn2+-exporting ATPase
MTAGDAVYRAMAFLVVASPCALVISTPAAVLSAIANGARHGILFKGGGVLDRAGSLDAIAFDKTGTLTVGAPRLLATETIDVGETDVLRLAASVEAVSEHHLARAVLRAAAGVDISPVRVEDFRAIPGQGVEARLDGGWAWVGNEEMAQRRSAVVPATLDD